MRVCTRYLLEFATLPLPQSILIESGEIRVGVEGVGFSTNLPWAQRHVYPSVVRTWNGKGCAICAKGLAPHMDVFTNQSFFVGQQKNKRIDTRSRSERVSNATIVVFEVGKLDCPKNPRSYSQTPQTHTYIVNLGLLLQGGMLWRVS